MLQCPRRNWRHGHKHYPPYLLQTVYANKHTSSNASGLQPGTSSYTARRAGSGPTPSPSPRPRAPP